LKQLRGPCAAPWFRPLIARRGRPGNNSASGSRTGEHWLRTPELYGWLLVAVLGTVFQQPSFRASSLTASLPTMTVTEPVAASLLGVTVLGETLGADGPQLIALAVAVVVVIVATAALARGEAASMAADEELRVITGRIPVPAPEVRSPVAAVAAGRA
jgi:hypothetical protein